MRSPVKNWTLLELKFMCNFWERCLTSAYRAFAAGNPAGRADVEWWGDLAFSRGLLDCSQLDVDSLLTLILVCSPGSEIGRRAAVEFAGRALEPSAVGEALISALPPDVNDWLLQAALDRDDLDRTKIHLEGLLFWFGAPLIKFLSRLYIVNISTVHPVSKQFLRETYESWEYPADESFVCELYRRSLNGIPRWVPHEFPMSPPDWLSRVSPQEHEFLERCLRLDRQQRVVLFATVYAELKLTDFTCAVRARNPNWTAGLLGQILRQSWRIVFR